MKKINKAMAVSFLFVQAIFAHDDDYQQIQSVISNRYDLLQKKHAALSRNFSETYCSRPICWGILISDVSNVLKYLDDSMSSIERLVRFRAVKDLNLRERFEFGEKIEDFARTLGKKYPHLEEKLREKDWPEKHKLIKDFIANLESLRRDKGWTELNFSLPEETIDAVFNLCEIFFKNGLIDADKRDKVYEMRPITLDLAKELKKITSMQEYLRKAEDVLVQFQLDRQPAVFTLAEKINLLKQFLSNSWSDEAIEKLFMMSNNNDFLIDEVIQDALCIEEQNPGVDINASYVPSFKICALSLPEQHHAVGRVYALSASSNGGAIHKVVSMISISDDSGIIGQLGETAQGSWRVASQLIDFNGKKILTQQTQILDKADGPSAGIAYFASLYSAKNQIALPPGLALTGALDLDGSINPVGGIPQKILATKFFGLSTLIVSERNRKDIEELPVSYRDGLSIHYVEETKNLIDFLDQFKKHTV